ncbi:hypothetical protein GAYE_SCF55G6308 [Galdieria yellowstonensis]|uniref:YggT family protein n=1 Tax=Galdieria yellowstonensis TaxID=3028027 RepID=A0AAV9ILL7_9RHOD|nr:hypothetical protein GAYE_SCF55G6308 [Galdieria yellowstonensis]
MDKRLLFCVQPNHHTVLRQFHCKKLNRKYCPHSTCHLFRVKWRLSYNWSMKSDHFGDDSQATTIARVAASIGEQKVHTAVGYVATITNWSCSVMVILMVLRIVLSWYPKKYSLQFPWVWVCLVTEPFLAPVRKVAQPVGGVDISPVIWLFVFSFLRELLVGQQGILVLLQSYSPK